MSSHFPRSPSPDIVELDCRKICRKAISALQKMTEGMQSGDDTPLKNIWDEVCVQVQFQKSFFWDAYVATIRVIINHEVEMLDAPRKEAIWLRTNEGIDWGLESEGQQRAGFFQPDIVDYILHEHVLPAAADWSNARIEKYLWSGDRPLGG